MKYIIHLVIHQTLFETFKSYGKEIYQCITILLTIGVEVVVAVSPAELRGKGRDDVEKHPGGDDHVVDGHEAYHDYGAVAETLEHRCHPGVRQGRSDARVLTYYQLQEEYRQTHG